MPNWSHQRDWAMKVIKKITVLKVHKKMDFYKKKVEKMRLYLKKVDIYISYSVSCSLQPTHPKQKPLDVAGPDTLGLRSPTKNGEKNKTAETAWGLMDGDGDGKCRNGWQFFAQ